MTLRELDSLNNNSDNSYFSFEGTVEDERQKAQDWLDQYHKTHDEPSFWESAGSLLKSAWDSGSSFASKAWGEIEDAFSPTASSVKAAEKTKKEEEDRFRLGKDLEDSRFKFGVGREGMSSTASEYINEISSKVSSTYKKYKGTDYLPLSENDIKELAAEHEARAKVDGQEAADMWLDGFYKDIAASNQSWVEQAWHAVSHLVPAIEGGVISTFGMAYGATKFTLEHPFGLNASLAEYALTKESYNPLYDFIDNVIDNPITRYGDEIERYGASHVLDGLKLIGWSDETSAERIAHTKATATEYNPEGITNDAILKTQEQENSIFNATLPWEALQSGGFTLLSIITGSGLAKGANMVFGNAAKGMRALHATGKVFKTEEALIRGLEGLKQVQNYTNLFAIPGAVGSVEGCMEGLHTKMDVQREGDNIVQDFFNKKIEQDTQRLLDSGKYQSEEAARIAAFKLNEDAINDAKKQVDYAASRAGVNNFFCNAAINGFMMQTFKAGLMAPPVRETLRNSRLTGWAFKKSKFNVSADNVVTPKTSKLKTILNVLKEPAGEGIEEWTQNISSETTSAAAENNISEFVKGRVDPSSNVEVGDAFTSDVAAAWTAFTGSLFNKESLQSAVLGTVSSVMGTPALAHRGYYRNEEGKLTKRSIFSLKNFTPSLNEKGEQETWTDVARRMTPWRSGLFSAVFEESEEQTKAKKVADMLTEWIKDPKNKEKWDGLVGTANWLSKMIHAAESNDQFSYRTAQMGKAINDIFMLTKLKGTEFYNSFMADLERAANLTTESASASDLIDKMRENDKEGTLNKSDEEIVQKINDNANKMLELISSVQKEEQNIDSMLGRVDDDTKQGLVFGKVMADSFRKRKEQLEEEVERIKSNITSSNNSNSSSEPVPNSLSGLIAKYGSGAAIMKAKEGIEKEIEEAKKRVADIEGKKEEDITDKERETLAKDKNSIAQKEEQLKEFDPIYEDDGKGGKKVISGLSSLVLTEEEIMNLDNISRAIMLAQGATKLYNATHQNHQKVNELNLKIDNLNRQIEEEDAKINKWSNPDGSAKKRHTKQLEKARGRHAELLEQKRQAMEELDAEQGEMKDKKKYYSDAQQAVIDNLVQQGRAIDDDFLDKIIDIGRIEKAQKAHNKQYIEILSDPRVFQNYVKEAQEEAKMNLTRMRAERLSRTVNYQDYADEFNNMMANPSNAEASEIISTLQRESDNQKREYYTEKAKELEEAGQEVKYDENGDLVGYKLETNWDKLVQNQEAVYNVALTVADDADMSDNDRSLTMAAAQYLLSKGVNIEDEDAVVDSLIEPDAQGEAGGNFRQYIEKRNSEVSEPQRIVYTSIGNVVEDFKKAISRIKAKRDAQESASVNAKAGHVDGGTSAVPPPKPSPAVQQPQAQDEQKDKKSFSFVNGSNPEDLIGFLEEQLADTIPDVWKEDIKAIAGKITGSNAPNAVKDLVLANLLNLKTYGKLSKEEFLDVINNTKASLIAKSNEQENKDNDYSKASKIIENIARYLYGQKDKEAPSSSNAFAAIIQCVNLKYFRERFPGTWPVLFADRHNIDNWLKDNPVSKDTDLFFLRDSAWDKEAADGMGDSYNQSENRPVVVAVEVTAPKHPENSTAIQVDGRWFQPIGILPSTTSVNSGSGHTKTIRKHIYEAEGCHLITENGAPDGEPLRTRITGANFIRAISPSGTDTPNRIVDLILQFVHPEERGKLSVSTLEDRKKNISFKAAVKRFIEHLGVKKINGKESLVYINDRMRGNPNERKGSPIAINRRTLADTTNSKTGRSLLEVLKDGDLEELENFNSRTQRILNRVLSPLFVNNAVHTDAMPHGGGLSPQDRKAAEEKATRLINGYLPGRTETSGLHGMSDYLFMNDDYSLSVEYDQEDFSTIKVKLESPNGETIDVGTYDLNDKNLPVKLLRDILYDGEEIRPFLLWQISYSDVSIVGNTDPTVAKAREEAIDNLIGLVGDDILIAPTNSLDYIIESVHIQSPFSGMPDSARLVNFPTVANPNNAGGSDAAPAGDGAITDGNGNSVLPDSGATFGGHEKPKTGKTPAEDRAKQLASAIVADSKRFTLAKDDKYYYVTDKATGKTTKYLRVTSIGSADIDAPAAVSDNPVEVAQRTTTQLNQAMQEIGIDMHYEDEMGDYLKQHGEEDADQFAMIGIKGAKGLDATEEATTRMDNLAIAKEMEAAGKDALTIKVATGWEKGADNKWRYETSDVQVKKKWFDRIISYPLEKRKGLEFTIDDILQKDTAKAVKQYSRIASLKITVYNDSLFDILQSTRGYYNPKTNTLMLNFASTFFGPKVTSEDIRSTLVHELQHLIQHEEGFASGGNTNKFNNYPEIRALKEDKSKLKETEEELFRIENESQKDLISKSATMWDETEEYKRWKKEKREFEERRNIRNGQVILHNSKIGEQRTALVGKQIKELKQLQEKASKIWNPFKRKKWKEAIQELKKKHAKELKDFDQKNPTLSLSSGVYDNAVHPLPDKLFNYQKYTEEERKRILEDVRELKRNWQKTSEAYKEIESAYSEIIKKIQKAEYSLYRRVAGEVESRTAEKRMNLSDEERRNSLFTEEMYKDVSREDLVFLQESSQPDKNLQFFQTPQGTVYGFATPEGSIYLDRRVIRPEHPIHEYTHLWDRAVIQKNERLWNRGVELMKKLDLWKAVLNDDNYGKKWKAKGISGKQLENLIASEVHSRLVGRRGQEYLEEVEAKHKGDRRSIVGKLRRWLLDMWKEVAKTFGVWTDEDLRNLTLNDFVNMTLRDLTQGINPNTATAENTTDAVLEEIQKRIDAIGENNIELTGKENAKELAEKLGVSVFEAKKLMAEARQKIREDSFKLWKVPSTTLGNTIDIIVRDFFNDELKTHYKNITDRALAVLVQQLEYFKINLGITIISKDVVAHGKVTVTDDGGNTRDIDVAGTVDLLGYDKNGNFYIFDMKTTRNHSPNKIVKEKPKWTRQLSMYRDLLLQQWQEKGLNIPKENIHIIPINVPRYPEPTSEDDYIVEDGQLKHKVNGEYKDYNMDIRSDKTVEDNGDNYFGLRQTTAKQVDLTYKKLDIQWDRMSADDQDIADEMLLADSDGLEGVVSSDLEKITIEGSSPNGDSLDPLANDDGDSTDDNPIDIPSINPIASQVSGTLGYDDFSPEQQGIIDDMDLSLEDIKDDIAALEEFAMCSTRRK